MGFFNNHLSSAATSGPAWVSGQTYNVNDLVVYNSTTYVCLVAHTASSSLFTDLASGNWRIVSTTKNYISNYNFESGSTTGWSLANTTLDSNKFPNQVSASWSAKSANLSMTTTSVGKLAGTQSLQLTQATAVSVAGDMLVSDAFTIDIADQAKVLSFSFSYSVTANPSNLNLPGTSSNSVGVAIYDVTNNAWIQPAGVFNLVQSSGVGKATGTFQTTSNSTQYRLAVYFPNASSNVVGGGAFTMLLDEFSVGPQPFSTGPAMSDWQSYTPVLTNFGNATATGKFMRIGDSIELSARAVIGSSLPTGILTFSIPTGLSIDLSKYPNSGNTNELTGFASASNSISSAAWSGALRLGSATTLFISGDSGANFWNATVPFTFAAGNQVEIKAIIPITGWSSNTVQSADTDTRVVAAVANVTSGSQTASGSVQTITNLNVLNDSTGSWNASTGVYTVPVTGWYRASGSFGYNATSAGKSGAIGISTSNGSVFGVTYSISSAPRVPPVTGLFYLTSGQTIQFQAYQDTGGSFAYSVTASDSRFSIERISGPAVVQATESVVARYKCTTAAVTNSTTPVNYDSKDYDSHGAVTTGSGWRFTAPVSGTYCINVSQSAGTATANTIYLYKGGSSTSVLAQGAANTVYSGSDCIKLLAGEYIDIRNGSGTSLTLIADSTINHISISRVGN